MQPVLCHDNYQVATPYPGHHILVCHSSDTGNGVRTVQDKLMRDIVWSYGGGVQSIALAALIKQGKVKRPKLALIADTGREASTTWQYLKDVVQPAMDFEIHIVPHSFSGEGYNYRDMYSGKDMDMLVIPAFTDITGQPGMLRSYCNAEWKREPVKRYLREHGITSADQYIGFSTDEAERMRVYDESKPWNHIYPLWDLRISRNDCYAIIRDMGWPDPPRSSCYICPYRTDAEWRDLLGTDDFDKAVQFERDIQKRDSTLYLHNSCTPLDEVDFSTEPDLFAKPCNAGGCFT